MKYLVIGLGNFGSMLATRLTQMGHEVIGIDNRSSRTDELRDALSSTICMDSSDIDALKTLPLDYIDQIVVAIGENFAASIQTVALLRQLEAQNIVARALSELHKAVLQSLGVDRIIFPEQEAAEIMAQSFELSGFQSSYRIDRDHFVMRFQLPASLAGSNVEQSGIERESLKILSVIRNTTEKNLIGISHQQPLDIGSITPQTILEAGDIIIVYGSLIAYHVFTRSLHEQ